MECGTVPETHGKRHCSGHAQSPMAAGSAAPLLRGQVSGWGCGVSRKADLYRAHAVVTAAAASPPQRLYWGEMESTPASSMVQPQLATAVHTPVGAPASITAALPEAASAQPQASLPSGVGERTVHGASRTWGSDSDQSSGLMIGQQGLPDDPYEFEEVHVIGTGHLF